MKMSATIMEMINDKAKAPSLEENPHVAIAVEVLEGT